jgi:hypothetical protein
VVGASDVLVSNEVEGRLVPVVCDGIPVVGVFAVVVVADPVEGSALVVDFDDNDFDDVVVIVVEVVVDAVVSAEEARVLAEVTLGDEDADCSLVKDVARVPVVVVEPVVLAIVVNSVGEDEVGAGGQVIVEAENEPTTMGKFWPL